METYLSIRLPIKENANWFEELKRQLGHLHVRWQNGGYHITLAFLNDSPIDKDVPSVISRHLDKAAIHSLTFDRLDVFTAVISKQHIINLTVSDVPEAFYSWVDGIRQDLKSQGCMIQSGFKLHVTLGRVEMSDMDLRDLQTLVGKIQIPSFSLPLSSLEYREPVSIDKRKGRLIKKWTIPR